jgi:hypothetical protein
VLVYLSRLGDPKTTRPAMQLSLHHEARVKNALSLICPKASH